MYGRSTAASTSETVVRKSLMTAQDIHQLRECFYEMEEKAQRTIASKNKHIQDLEAELQELKEAFEQKSRQGYALSKDISGAKQKLKAYGATSPNDDLLDMIDLYHQMATEQLKTKSEDMAQLEGRLSQIENDKQALRIHMEKYNRAIDEMKEIILERGFTDPNDKERTLLELLEKRINYEIQQIDEKEDLIHRKGAQLNELQLTLQEKVKHIQILQLERKDAVERIRGAKEMITKTKLYERFRFSMKSHENGTELDIMALIESLDNDLMSELNACDEEVSEVRKRLTTVESTVADKTLEIERLKKDLKQLQDEKESKTQEITRMNDQLRMQTAAVRRKIEQLEAKDKEIEELKRTTSTMESEMEEKARESEQIEREIAHRESSITSLQEQVLQSQQHVGEKVVMLTALLEKMQAAREDFEVLDEQIEEINSQLEKTQAARVSSEEHMRRIRKEEEYVSTRVATRAYESEAGQPRLSSRSQDRTYADDELNVLFKTAKKSLHELGEKANISVVSIRSKSTADTLFQEQMSVSGAETKIRDQKINILADKLGVVEKCMSEILNILGRKLLYQYPSTRTSLR